MHEYARTVILMEVTSEESASHIVCATERRDVEAEFFSRYLHQNDTFPI